MDNGEGQSFVSFADQTAPSFTGQVLSAATADKLQLKICALENEILDMKRQKTVILDEAQLFKGKDERKVLEDLINRYNKESARREDAENKLSEATKQYRNFQEDTAKNFDALEKQCKEWKEKCRILEASNLHLQEQIDNDKSLIFKLESDRNRASLVAEQFFMGSPNKSPMDSEADAILRKEFEEKVSTLKASNTELRQKFSAIETTKGELEKELEKVKQMLEVSKNEAEGKLVSYREKIDQLEDDYHKAIKIIKAYSSINEAQAGESIQNYVDGVVQQMDESSLNVSANTAEQVAGNMLLILENLDKNQRNTAELQAAIVDFLDKKGLYPHDEGASSNSHWFRTLFEKRRQKIKADQKQLEQEYRGNNPQLDLALQKLDEDSLMISQTDNSLLHYSMDNANADKVIDQTVNLNECAMDIIGRASSLSEVLVALFEKLINVGEFFQRTLDLLGVKDKGLLEKIRELRIDLDKSICEARSINVEAKNAEKSIRKAFEKSMNTSAILNVSAASYNDSVEYRNVSVQPSEMSMTVQKCAFCESLKQTLHNELANKDGLSKRVKELEAEKENWETTKKHISTSMQEELEQLCDTLTSTHSQVESLKKPRVGRR